MMYEICSFIVQGYVKNFSGGLNAEKNQRAKSKRNKMAEKIKSI